MSPPLATRAADGGGDARFAAGGAEAPRALKRRDRLFRVLAFIVAIAAVVSGIATVISMSRAYQPDPDVDTIRYLLAIDVALMVILGGLVGMRLARLWAERQRGLAGSGLLIRMVVMFALVAVTPGLLVALLAGAFLKFGFVELFAERVRTAVNASDAVAKAYLVEHRNSIRAEAFAMADDLNRDAAQLLTDRRLFDHRLSLQANLRSIPEAIVIDSQGQVLAKTPLSLSLILDLDLVPRQAIEKANRGEVALLTKDSENRVRALVKLNRFVDAYLIVGRFIDLEVLENIERTAAAVAYYNSVEASGEWFRVTFILIFVVVAMLLLLAAVWTGLTLASQISRPIADLIDAADGVRKGDLSVRVDPAEGVAEIKSLSRSFNRMTDQLETQRSSLIEANRQLDERRRFTEMVLSGVSAGVIGLDAGGLIHLPNRSASLLLGTDLDSVVGSHLQDVAPEMAELFAKVRNQPDRSWEAEIEIFRDMRKVTLITRIAAERVQGEVVGYIVTFDDISALVSAQRTAAWADVARRIAHEIKNPLTPIQLAAERLQRKYGRDLGPEAAETFANCTNTIARRVEDIRRMVDEFSSFARMPRPEIRAENLNDLVRQAVFLERTRSPKIKIHTDLPAEPTLLACDARQISQVFTNVLKNASEAIVERGGGEAPEDGEIRVQMISEEDPCSLLRTIRIVFEDNGCGLPVEQRERLTEPYVTTRSKGTGLGLAIVRKIMEDHGAELTLEDQERGGARIGLTFHVATSAADDDAMAGEADTATG